VPITLDPQKLHRNSHILRVIARLKPGVKLPQAQAELDLLGRSSRSSTLEDNKDKGSPPRRWPIR